MSQPIKMGMWLVGVFGFFRLFELIFETPELDSWALVSLGLGLYLFSQRPLKSYGFPTALESGIAVFLSGAFIIHFGLVVIGPKIEADNSDNEPCGPKTKEAQCYNLSHTTCLSVWNNFEKECLQKARAIQQSRPTALVGAGVKSCVQKKFNRYMSYNKRIENTSGCRDYFDGLKE